ncbi:MAG: prolyl oligopeptidase family serine peptidase [Pseudomonadota bacterium]
MTGIPLARAAAVLALALAALSAQAQPSQAQPSQPCGADSDCVIGARTYRIYVPETATPPFGGIVFAHGYQGSAAGVMRSKWMRGVADRLGVALIAGKSKGADWRLPGAPSEPLYRGREELDYFRAVLDDAAARHPIDRGRLMATGFSAGGMMVWNLICHESPLFAAFAPMAGVFWRPEPARCDSPAANVLHIHGTRDRTVPLTGRPIGPTHQGDVRKTFAMYIDHGRYGPARAEPWGDDMTCERRDNADGKSLDLCLFDGAHRFRASYVERAWRHFAARGAL